MNVTVNFDFSEIGRVRQEDGKLRFPATSEEPGIYQFAIGESIYVGETDRLRRRFQHYRNPGPSQFTNIRINQSIGVALNEGLEVVVSTIVKASISIDGVDTLLDLSKKSARLLVESAVLSSAHLSDKIVENL